MSSAPVPKSLLVRGTAAVAALLLPGVLPLAGHPSARADEPDPDYTFVSHPDFTNADIGDTTQSPLWEEGDPNGINDSYRAGVTTVIDTMLSERPDSVLVDGDLVDGHWGQDVDQTGIFGPVVTDQQKRAAVTAAGDLYYSQWWARLKTLGQAAVDAGTIAANPQVHAALGDHDIGDNPWSGGADADFKRSAVPTYRAAWARYATRLPADQGGGYRYGDHPAAGEHTDTAYATYLSPDILLVTVDVFRRTDTGVDLSVRGDQLRWLDAVLQRADDQGVRWVVVQGHVPVLFPVRARYSSRLRLARGADSAFWKTLVRHKVDLYLCGEVHDTTARTRGGVMQICHGGAFVHGESSYLVGRFFGDQLQLTVKDMVSGAISADPGRLWETAAKRPVGEVNYPVDPDTGLGRTTVGGTMTLTSSNTMLDATGNLEPYEISAGMRGRRDERSLTGRGTWTATATQPDARFQFQTRTATGATALGSKQATDWRTSATLSRRLTDGRTICTRARARLLETGLTSAWTGWRCVYAPYDDRALTRLSGSIRHRSAGAAFHATTTVLRGTSTSVKGPWVSKAADRIAVGALRAPNGGTVKVYVGGQRIGTVHLTSTDRRFAWRTLDPGPHHGRLRLTKTGPGRVWLDGVEISHRS